MWGWELRSASGAVSGSAWVLKSVQEWPWEQVPAAAPVSVREQFQ